MRHIPVLAALLIAALLQSCGNSRPDLFQGYIEGDYVYVASNLSGRLVRLEVAEGGTVAQGQPLFSLEQDYEAEAVRQSEAGIRQAEARAREAEAGIRQAEAQMEQAQAQVGQAEATVAQARANLSDLNRGLRPEELEQISASLSRARTALELSRKELARRQALFGQDIIPREDLDRAESEVQAGEAAVRELEARLAAGRLPARTDRITAAEAELAAAGASLEQARAAQTQAQAGVFQARAALEQAQAGLKQAEAARAQARWTLDQKTQKAPVAGLVFDILHRVGDWVPSGSPVVSLLPPENIKVRFFVPEPRLADIRTGGTVSVIIDGREIAAVVSYISPQAEYTPPVIYSQEFRNKLVFLVEARFPEATATAHPGLPVDVRLQKEK